MAIWLYGDDENGEPAEQRDVCPDCAAAGPAGTAERALEYAAWLRERVMAQERLAARLPEAEPWATPEELEERECETLKVMGCPPHELNMEAGEKLQETR